MKKLTQKSLLFMAILTVVFLPTNAMALTWNLTSGWVSSGNNFGNSLTYNSGSHQLVANSWADGGPNDTFQDARIRVWGSGIGSCNRGEGLNCPSPVHQVDNGWRNDWVLFQLNGTHEFEKVTIDPWGTWDRDVTFWVGNVAPDLDLTGKDYSDLASLGFGAQTDVFNTVSSSAIDVFLNNQVGNALLFGPYKDEIHSDSNTVLDYFKIRKLYTDPYVIPEPATMTLFGTGLLGAFLRRKKKVA